METGKESLAKLISQDDFFNINDKAVVFGRNQHLIWKQDVLDKNFKEKYLKDLKKIPISGHPKTSHESFLIIYKESKKKFLLYNLSKNILLVNDKYVKRFEHVRLKNKSPILVGTKLFFFVYSNKTLVEYYKEKLSSQIELTDKKEIEESRSKKEIGIENGDSPYKERKSRKRKKEARGAEVNANFSFENIIQPPNPGSTKHPSSLNILDDLIENANKRQKIN